jgi:hypothetical protein
VIDHGHQSTVLLFYAPLMALLSGREVRLQC